MFDFNVLWILSSLQLMVLVTPGASVIIVARNSVIGGLLGGVSTALGISLAIALHVTLSILAPALISESNSSFYVLKFMGGVYLLWLSYKLWVSSIHSSAPDKTTNNFSVSSNTTSTIYQYIKMGFLIDILNPYIFLFHFSTFIKFIPSSTSLKYKSIYVSAIIIISLLWFIFVSLFLSIHIIEKKLNKYSKLIERCASLILLLFACQLLKAMFY